MKITTTKGGHVSKVVICVLAGWSLMHVARAWWLGDGWLRPAIVLLTAAGFLLLWIIPLSLRNARNRSST